MVTSVGTHILCVIRIGSSSRERATEIGGIITIQGVVRRCIESAISYSNGSSAAKRCCDGSIKRSRSINGIFVIISPISCCIIHSLCCRDSISQCRICQHTIQGSSFLNVAIQSELSSIEGCSMGSGIGICIGYFEIICTSFYTCCSDIDEFNTNFYFCVSFQVNRKAPVFPSSRSCIAHSRFSCI